MIDSIMGKQILIQYTQANYIVSVLNNPIKTKLTGRPFKYV